MGFGTEGARIKKVITNSVTKHDRTSMKSCPADTLR